MWVYREIVLSHNIADSIWMPDLSRRNKTGVLWRYVSIEIALSTGKILLHPYQLITKIHYTNILYDMNQSPRLIIKIWFTIFISKKHFRPGEMAASGWARSVRAVRDTPVADYSAPSVNTTRCVAYCPPIVVSPSLLTLLAVSYFRQTLWRCGQLWPYVGMGSLGIPLHRDCTAMGDAAKNSPHVPSTSSSRSVQRWWEDMILPGREDSCNCMDPRNFGQREWDQKLGKIECEVSLYDKRRWKWDDVYLLRGLPNIYSPSLCPPQLPLYLRTTAVAPWWCTWSSMFEMHLETEIESTQRCTWRPESSELGDALGGHDCANWQAVVERVWRYTWRPRSSEIRRCTCRPWLIEFRDALWGCDQASLEMHLQAMIERDWRSTCRRSIQREARWQLRLYSLVNL